MRGVVQFTEDTNAADAIKNCNGKDFMGRKIILGWAIPSAENENTSFTKVKVEPEEEIAIKKEKYESEDEKCPSNTNVEQGERKKGSRLKEIKKSKNARKGRLIVRNLPFNVTESNLRDHFKAFGEITEVKLLRKADGKLVGCRPIIVDWAVPKSVFNTNNQVINPEETKIKEEPVSDNDSENIDEDEVQELKLASDETDSNLTKTKEDESEEDDDNQLISDDESTHNGDVKKPKVISNDVSEGRTVFIKNVPFSATNEDIKACMEQFGKVIYALVCIDPVTEHSKGTAFVKFQKQWTKLEKKGNKLVLHDEILDVHKALNKEDLEKKSAMKHEEKKNKDSRNLYLVKEGVIVAGSKAAAGVSMTDMAKRLQLEQWKSQMLRNLNMYVSPVRLIMHNVPPSWTDDKLRKLFRKHAGPKAVIKEARIMRDMKNIDAKGVGKSKEFGFVTFNSHENALEALRNINNNPNIFTSAKRPIVAFSIENKAIMNIKQKRLEKSRTKNPLYSGNVDHQKGGKLNSDNHERKPHESLKTEEERDSYVGVTSKPGNTKMRNRFRLKTQAKLHSQMVHKTKLKQKKQHKIEQHKQITKEKIKDSKPKKGTKRKLDEDDSTFSKLVSKYKDNLISASGKKWYE
ncbi:RNA-binding protein 28 [Blattella germanica]|nr:RNA-binding protein 28 [Blattella germanica]